jgi:hypothetical protein
MVSQSGKCRTFRVSSIAVGKTMMKLALMRTATGKKDAELPLLQGISSLELPASEITAQINSLQGSSNRHISTSIVQRRLRESGLCGWNCCNKKTVPPVYSLAAVILLLLFNCLLIWFLIYFLPNTYSS